ncbi:hypothetical protein ABZP36_025422 [Zizania latifolia]
MAQPSVPQVGRQAQSTAACNAPSSALFLGSWPRTTVGTRRSNSHCTGNDDAEKEERERRWALDSPADLGCECLPLWRERGGAGNLLASSSALRWGEVAGRDGGGEGAAGEGEHRAAHREGWGFGNGGGDRAAAAASDEGYEIRVD